MLSAWEVQKRMLHNREVSNVDAMEDMKGGDGCKERKEGRGEKEGERGRRREEGGGKAHKGIFRMDCGFVKEKTPPQHNIPLVASSAM